MWYARFANFCYKIGDIEKAFYYYSAGIEKLKADFTKKDFVINHKTLYFINNYIEFLTTQKICDESFIDIFNSKLFLYIVNSKDIHTKKTRQWALKSLVKLELYNLSNGASLAGIINRIEKILPSIADDNKKNGELQSFLMLCFGLQIYEQASLGNRIDELIEKGQAYYDSCESLYIKNGNFSFAISYWALTISKIKANDSYFLTLAENILEQSLEKTEQNSDLWFLLADIYIKKIKAETEIEKYTIKLQELLTKVWKNIN